MDGFGFKIVSAIFQLFNDNLPIHQTPYPDSGRPVLVHYARTCRTFENVEPQSTDPGADALLTALPTRATNALRVLEGDRETARDIIVEEASRNQHTCVYCHGTFNRHT